MLGNLALALTGSIIGVAAALGVTWLFLLLIVVAGQLEQGAELLVWTGTLLGLVFSAIGVGIALRMKKVDRSSLTAQVSFAIGVLTLAGIWAIGAAVSWADARDAARTLTVMTSPVAAVLARYLVETRLA